MVRGGCGGAYATWPSVREAKAVTCAFKRPAFHTSRRRGPGDATKAEVGCVHAVLALRDIFASCIIITDLHRKLMMHDRRDQPVRLVK